MGTGENPDGKADEDYAKRTKDIPEDDRGKTTFVFVTPRRWQGRETWISDKTSRNEWADVLAIDASGLETWLEQVPYVHLWLSHEVNGRVSDPRALENWWRQWSDRSYPYPMPPKLVLVGRERQQATFISWLEADPNTHTLRAPDVDEAVAFVGAALIGPNPDTDSRLMRAVVVTREEAWREVITIPRSLILIPTFPYPWAPEAVRRGHHVIIPVSQEEPVAEMELPPLEDADLLIGIQGLGIDAERAERLIGDAAGSLLTLRRGLSQVEEFRRPAWSAPDVARSLVPAVLIGTWDGGHPGDRSILAALAGRDYETLEENLEALAASEDPPVRRAGSTWFLSSNEDTWAIVRQHVTAAEWSAFAKVAVDVLGAPDPAWDLPPEDRWAAAIHGKRPLHSERLRRAFADTVAMMGGWRGFEALPEGRSGPQLAGVIVRQLLERVNEDASGARWAAINDELPQLAEAAPDLFITAMSSAVSGDKPIVAALMADAEAGGTFGRITYAGMLWALETLAWSPDYLEPAAGILARWAANDPGGRTSNRPSASLRDIFLSWHPQTSASLDARLAILNKMRREEPTVAWTLFFELVPAQFQTAMMTARPRWRRWAPSSEITVSRAEIGQAVRTIGGWLLEDARSDPSRWAQILDLMPSLPDEFDEALLDGLNRLQPEELPPEELEQLAKKLRETIGHHRAYADADWAMAPDRVDKLAAVAEQLRPSDPISLHRWLFTSHPDLAVVVGKEHERYDEALAELRRQALENIVADRGPGGVEALAEAADMPEAVGWAAVSLGNWSDERALTWVASPSDRLRRAASGYIRRRTVLEGWPWADAAIRSATSWTPEQTARALLAASDTEEAWALASGLGDEVEAAYWAGYAGYPRGDAAHGAARKLLEFGRPFEAVDLLGSQPDLNEPFDQDLAYAALFAAAHSQVPTLPNAVVMFQYDLARLLTALEERGFDQEKLAQLEWSCLPLLEHSERPPRLLGKRLATDPAFFVEVISAVFHRAGDEPADVDEAAQGVAANGYRLLASWRTLPGEVGGAIDETALRVWVDEARRLLADAGRQEIGDQRLGQVLWYSPPGADGLRPHEAIRNVLEDLANDQVETGFAIEAINSRGVHFVSRTEPGKKELELAEGFESQAAQMESRWPRTAQVLRGLGASYRAEAKREQDDAAVTEREDQERQRGR
jgi:hypothetical protein